MTRKHDYAYCGLFTEQWRNPPKPFNPDFDPKAKDRYAQVTASMEADDYYSHHTRKECAKEWRTRYDALK
jgi:hypothetical protein